VSTTEAPGPELVDLKTYRRFIGQIELQAIWLAGAKIDNRFGPATPEQTSIQIEDTHSWEEIHHGFRASVRYRVRFKQGAKIQSTIEATYAADFTSAAPMTDEIFSVFAKNNLPLNTWPYLRAFVSDTLGRMGWLPFALPAFKINVMESVDTPSTGSRSRRKTGKLVDDDVPF